MSTTAPARTSAPGTRTAPKVTQLGVLRSEWTKLRSLRSTWWTLLIAVVLMVGLAALAGAVTANQYAGWDAPQRAEVDGLGGLGVALSGVTFAQLAIAVLGVLVATGEYSTGMVRATLTAVPRRLPVLWGKIGVYATLVVLVSAVMTLAAFLVSQPLLSGVGLDVGLSTDGVLRSLVGAVGYLTLVGMIAVAVGMLLRSTAGGISAVVAAFFLATPLIGLLPSSWSDPVAPYLPGNAGSAMFDSAMLDDPLSAGGGFAVMLTYAVVLVAAAAWRLRRTDA